MRGLLPNPEFAVPVDAFDMGPEILDNVCRTLGCSRTDLSDFVPVPEGLTNVSFRFGVNGQQFVYRHPGRATQGILDRAAEAQAESIACELGLDATFVYLDPGTGWKISRFYTVTGPFDYHDPAHVRAALTAVRTLHDCGRVINHACDLLAGANDLVERLRADGACLDNADLDAMMSVANRLDALCKADGIAPVLCHNDFYAPNILISDAGVALIDWEYAGMGDAAADLGTFICCSDYTWDEALGVFDVYFGRPPTTAELRHGVAFVGLAGFFWWVWAMFKDACGEPVGQWESRWYHYAREFGHRALEMYAC